MFSDHNCYATTYDAYQRLQNNSNQTSQEQLANLAIVAGGVLTSLSLATGAAMMFSKTPLLIGLNLALTVAGLLVDGTGCALNFSQNGLTSDSMFQLVSLVAFNGGRSERNLYKSLWRKKSVTPSPPSENRNILITLGLTDNMEGVETLANRASTSPVDMMYLLKLVKNRPALAPAVRQILVSKFLVQCPEDLAEMATGKYDTFEDGMSYAKDIPRDIIASTTEQLRIELEIVGPSSKAIRDNENPEFELILFCGPGVILVGVGMLIIVG